jgi:integrase
MAVAGDLEEELAAEFAALFPHLDERQRRLAMGARARSLGTKLIHAHNLPGQGPCPKDQLPHARLHDLRHIHATTLLLSGVPVHVVAARLGHADPAITLRVYAHVIRSAEAAAADIFAQAVKAA